ncbi:hypothetical protein [Psychrobacter cibarius]|jgi:hypothetical protein|uniref:hypothetical protein n=1 Tax=Psychrobacter cibarius TaxID=282669 RepID=UPI0019196AA3|nr:hypothetical protein [Psychrobacter cibarius]
MSKRTKKAIRKNVKSINVKDNLIVHECAIKPYQIFCEWIDDEANKFSLSEPLLFEVVEIDGQYCFFEGFKEMGLLMDGAEISIRRVDISRSEIERRAWVCLMKEFTNLVPINPKFFTAIKSSMPARVQQALFNKPLTIQHILDITEFKRYHYDYQLSLYPNQQPTKIPSFSELIDKVLYVNKK